MPSVYGEVGKDQFQTPPIDVNLVPNILPVQTNIAISAHDLGGTKSVISWNTTCSSRAGEVNVWHFGFTEAKEYLA